MNVQGEGKKRIPRKGTRRNEFWRPVQTAPVGARLLVRLADVVWIAWQSSRGLWWVERAMKNIVGRFLETACCAEPEFWAPLPRHLSEFSKPTNRI